MKKEADIKDNNLCGFGGTRETAQETEWVGSNWGYLGASERFGGLSVIQGHYGGWVWAGVERLEISVFL